MAESRIFPANLDYLNDVLAFLEGFLKGRGASVKVTYALIVSLEELFVNVASYAYEGPGGEAEISLDFDEKMRTLIIVLKDSGIPFDPLAKEDPDITLSAEERSIGGLGIFMVKQTMDSIAYQRENDQNIVRMTKQI